MANMLCSLISPEKILFQEEINSLVCPMLDGQMGVLPGHAPFLGKLGIGIVKIQAQNQEHFFAVDSGFLEVKNNEVSLLVNRAKKKADMQSDVSTMDEIEGKLRDLKAKNLGDEKVLQEIAWMKTQKQLLEYKD